MPVVPEGGQGSAGVSAASGASSRASMNLKSANVFFAFRLCHSTWIQSIKISNGPGGAIISTAIAMVTADHPGHIRRRQLPSLPQVTSVALAIYFAVNVLTNLDFTLSRTGLNPSATSPTILGDRRCNEPPEPAFPCRPMTQTRSCEPRATQSESRLQIRCVDYPNSAPGEKSFRSTPTASVHRLEAGQEFSGFHEVSPQMRPVPSPDDQSHKTPVG